MLPVLLKAQEENLNEADTGQRLVMFFEQVLGYDPLTEVTREAMVKEKYVDFALKVDGAVKLLVEAKAAGVDLRDRHIDQAKSYAAEANIRWVLLTNGVIWSLYHLTFEEGIEYARVFQVNLAACDFDAAAEQLSLLHRRNIAAAKHEKFWQLHAALDPCSLGKALYGENVLRLMRRDIRRREGILVDEEDLANAIHAMLSTESREKIGPVKIRRRRAPRASAAAAATSAAPVPAQPSATPPTTKA
ncbi:MAG TPA: type I restriction enzyme HsdR N-terminal domain-containing protein [Candidatus Acidoferrales bacterium]|jgi:hypothetical protein|nr:type I restriction enzyme HsdR N-terminal domain-containing protein [Candidatus Acidoferrales bacterium]